MPLRTDIKKVLVIGAGPIVIGQACEFDYSGTQALPRAQARTGLEVVLLNSNPATIMTDPGVRRPHLHRAADCPRSLERIIEKEKPDALLPTLGGQTGAQPRGRRWRSRACSARHGVELIGASLEAIETAEDRELFKKAMRAAGMRAAAQRLRRARVAEARALGEELGYPAGACAPRSRSAGWARGWCTTCAELREAVRIGIAGAARSARC